MGISQTTIDRLLKDQRGLCPLCGRDLYQGMHAHHAIYGRDIRFAKWLDTEFNLVLLCPRCHSHHGKLSNIEGRKRFWKIKCDQGYEMTKWADLIPMRVKDRFEED